jgi:hypothetical protein
MRGSYFRAKAEQCRQLLAIAAKSDVQEQLRLWIEEFDGLAACCEERARRRITAPTPRHRCTVPRH